MDGTFNIMIGLVPENLLNIFVVALFHGFHDNMCVFNFVNDNPHMVSFGVDSVKLLALGHEPLWGDLIITREKVVPEGGVIVEGICEDVMKYVFSDEHVTGF